MTAVTPGQAEPAPGVTSAQSTYERYRQAMYERGVIVCDWDGLTAEDRESWDAALADALDAAAQQPQPGCPDPSQHRDVYGRPLPQPAPGDVEAAFASGARVRTAPCPVAAHDREHFQVRTGGHWLCGHLLARMLIAQGIAADPLAAAAPPLGTAWRLLDQACEQLAKVRAIVFRSDTQQSRIRDLVELLDTASTAQPQPAPELAADDVHVDWHMTSEEWRQLAAVLALRPDLPYVRALIDAGKVPAFGSEPTATVQPAPELAAAMAETRELRTALRTLADLWDASSDKDEETARRPNRAYLVLEERATVRRACAADIRKLAGPEGK